MFETLSFLSVFSTLLFVVVYGYIVVNSNDFKTTLIRTLRSNHEAEFVRRLSPAATHLFYRSEHHDRIHADFHKASNSLNKSSSSRTTLQRLLPAAVDGTKFENHSEVSSYN
jgi:hypothetical protein